MDGGGLVSDRGLSEPASPSREGMANLMPADPSRGFSTPYYAAYTNDKDLAGAVMVSPGARVRLIDPTTGEVFLERNGPEGAQELVTLANAVSQDLGRKAQWAIQGETGPDQFTTMAAERYDPKKTGLLGTILKVAAPVLGAMIPGLAPALGAALASGAATAATGGNLKQSLLGAVSGGLGNVLGGGLTSALGGGSFGSGVSTALRPNAGSLIPGAATGAGAGAASGAAATGAGSGLTSAAQTTGALAGNSATSRATSGLIGAVATGGAPWAGELLVTAPAGQSGVGALTGGLTGTAVDQALRGGQPLQPGEVPLEEVTVTAGGDQGIIPPVTGYYDIPGFTSTELSALNNSSFGRDQRGLGGNDSLIPTPAQLGGDLIGGVGADLITGQLAQVLGLGPRGDLSGVPDAGYEQGTTVGPITDVGVGGSAVIPPTAGGPTAPPSGGGRGSTPPTATAPPSSGGSGGGGAAAGGLPPLGDTSSAAAPSGITSPGALELEGGLAPDIYPWRQVRM